MLNVKIPNKTALANMPLTDFNDVEKICNMCGKRLDIWDKQEDFSLHRKLGFGTRYDGDILDIHLCCDCMEKLIDECLILPITDNT